VFKTNSKEINCLKYSSLPANFELRFVSVKSDVLFNIFRVWYPLGPAIGSGKFLFGRGFLELLLEMGLNISLTFKLRASFVGGSFVRFAGG